MMIRIDFFVSVAQNNLLIQVAVFWWTLIFLGRSNSFRRFRLRPSTKFRCPQRPQTAASFCLRFDLADCERVVLVFVKLLRTCALRLDQPGHFAVLSHFDHFHLYL